VTLIRSALAVLRPRRRARSTAASVRDWDEGSLYTLRERAPDTPTGQTPPGHRPAHGRHRPRIDSRQAQE